MLRGGKKDLLGVISTSDAEKLLTDLANFHRPGLSAPSVERFFQRWGELFPDYDRETEEGRAGLYNFLTIRLIPALQKVWNSPNLREREWYANRVRRMYNEDCIERSPEGKRLRLLASRTHFSYGSGTPPEEPKVTDKDAAVLELERLREAIPPITPFDAAIQHFQHILARAAHCQNAACATPYFIAAKVGQMYCSAPCARPAQQEAKRRWWKERGAEWRSEKNNQRKKVGK
jgi:hypothetical protein